MFLRLALASLVRRWPRRALALASLWIGNALFASLLAIGLGVGDAMDREFSSFGANLRVEPVEAAVPARLAGEAVAPPAEALLALADLERIGTIFWRNNVVGVVPRFRTEVALGDRTTPLLGLGVEPARKVYRHWAVEGAWPAAGECLVGEVLARGLAASRGSSIEVAGRTWTVSGVLATGGPEDEAVVAPLAAVQEVAGRPGKITDADVAAVVTPENELARRFRADPASLTPAEYERWACTPYPSNVAAQIQAAVPGSSVRVVRRVAETHGAVLARLSGLLWFLGLTGLFACALAVLGILSPAVIARAPEAALFVALGAHRLPLLSLFLAEASILGLAGGALGGATGAALGAWLLERVFGIAEGFQGVLVLLGALVGIALSSAATYLPVRGVLARRPAARLRA